MQTNRFALPILALAFLSTMCVEGQPTQDAQTVSKPEPKPLSALVAPSGFATFKANCFAVVQVQGGVGVQLVVAFVPSLECQPKTNANDNINQQLANINAVVKQTVPSIDEIKNNIIDPVNGNLTSVQSAVIDSIVKVLDDQSVKCDDIKGIINAASQQIADDVTQRLQKIVQAEVARQLKESQRPNH